jgi:hypothetical protein
MYPWTPSCSGFLTDQIGGIMGHMPALTRRRNPDAPQEIWHVYYGDVRVGSIALRLGNPADTDLLGLELRLLSRISSPKT